MRKPAAYGWVFLFFLSIYVITAGGHYYSSDGLTIYLVARSLVRQGTIYLTETTVLHQLAIVFGVDNNSVPVVLPAQSILMIPLYLVGLVFAKIASPQFTHYLLQLTTSFLNAFVTAFLVTVFYLFLLKLGYDKKVAFITTSILALATIVWPYSKFDFSEPVLALFVLTGFYFTYSYKSDHRLYQAFLGGAFLGMAELTKVAAVLAIGPLALYFVWTLYEDWRKRQERSEALRALILFGAGMSIFFLGLLYYNYLRFGSLAKTGYGEIALSTPIITGLYGLTLSTGKGMFLYSPAMLLFFGGIRGFFLKHRAETAAIAATILITVFFYARLHVWHGDVALGPRYLVYLTPFFLLPAAQLISNFGNSKAIVRYFIVFVVVLGFMVQLITISVFYNNYLDSLIIKYSSSIGGYDAKTQSLSLEAVYFKPNLSPVYGELISIPSRFAGWKNLIVSKGYTPVPADAKKIFPWFLKEVPDFWWVYFSMTTISRKFLIILMFPFAGAIISGWRLRRRIFV